MVWVAISWYLITPFVILDSSVTSTVYGELLGNQVHPIVSTLLQDGNAIFLDANAPIHTAGRVQEWFHKHADEIQDLLWPAQSPDLNIIEPFFCCFGNQGSALISTFFIST